MRNLWLGALVALTFLDMLFYEVRFTTVALLFVILRMQANNSAQKLLEDREREALAREPSPVAPPVKEPEEKTAKILVMPQPEKIRAPKFRGKPHEVLGIDEHAATGLILKAFRKWIQQYHPDHMPQGVQDPNLLARELHEARDFLLERRKERRRNRAS